MGDIITGIKTDELLDKFPLPYGFQVNWIAWDSPFRESDLQIGDIIVGLNGTPYSAENRRLEGPKAVGNYHESSKWEEIGAKPDDIILLDVFRDHKALQIEGKLMAYPFYSYENQRALADEGPNKMKNDGFSGSWGGWHETFTKEASRILSDRYWSKGLVRNTKQQLEKWQSEKERIDFLVKNYPGKFAATMQQDWQSAYQHLKGETVEVTEEMLEYRELGAKRKEIAKEAAQKAYADFKESIKDELIKTFPTIDPIRDHTDTVAGKLVEWPWITFRKFINILAKSYAVTGSYYDGYYFAHLNSPSMDRFFDSQFRYQAQVNPNINERYRFIGRILPEPILLTVDEKPVTGLQVEMVGAMVGDEELFVDLRNPDENNRCAYAGEELLRDFSPVEVRDDMTPREVMETMVLAIKLSNKGAWQGLFADWRASVYWGDQVSLNFSYHVKEASFIRRWEASRRLIIKDVYDVRIKYVGPVYTIIEADEKSGIPRVQEVQIILEHIGKFDEEYRPFINVNVNRKWKLQRLDEGPWRIAELVGL